MPKSYHYPQRVSPRKSSSFRSKRPVSLGVIEFRDGHMVDIRNHKVCAGPVTSEEWDFLVQFGFLKLTETGDYCEVETETESEDEQEEKGDISKSYTRPTHLSPTDAPHLYHQSCKMRSPGRNGSSRKGSCKNVTTHNELDVEKIKTKKNGLSDKLKKKTGKIARLFRKK